MSKFKNILVHVDAKSEVQPALACAVQLARRDQAGLSIVCASPDFNWPARLLLRGYEQIFENIVHAKSGSLKEAAAPLIAEGLTVTTKVVDAPPAVGVVREVLKHNHDLVVQAAEGRHSKFFGATATRLLRKCPCPVLVVNTKREFHCRKVLAAVTCSDDEVHQQLNTRILQLARQMSEGGVPDVISGWQAYGEHELELHMDPDEFEGLEDQTKALAERQIGKLLQPFGMQLSDDNVQLVHADAAELIPHVARERDIDLLVMGSVGRKGIAGLLLGNIAEQVLDQVECSVLAIKPVGFVSSVKV